VLGDALRGGLRPEMVGEALDVEPELLGVADEVGGSECVLVLEKQDVDPPEGARGGGPEASAASSPSGAGGSRSTASVRGR
jgi:hypothetical protein